MAIEEAKCAGLGSPPLAAESAPLKLISKPEQYY